MSTPEHFIKSKIRKGKIRVEVFQGSIPIHISEVNVSPTWSLTKRKQAKNFFVALTEAKLSHEGKLKLKTADELIDELASQASYKTTKGKRR